MTAAATPAPDRSHDDTAHRVSWVDWLMLLLAVFSVGLLTWEMLADLPADTPEADLE